MADNIGVYRSVTPQDIDALWGLIVQAGPGLTSLPKNREMLEKKLARAEASFKHQLPKEACLFLFVLEDPELKKVVGLSGIEATAGFHVPFYDYKISLISQACEPLAEYHEHPILQLVNDYQHYSELCSLLLHPTYRRQGSSYLLSHARCLFISQHPEYFSEYIMAEIRGLCDSNGLSPFWEGLGRHFFSMNFKQADYLTVMSNKDYIAELMPHYPIYIELLPKSAQEAIGVTHPESRSALKMLKQEGFTYHNYIDIFDGGPAVEARIEDLKTVKESQVLPCRHSESAVEGAFYLLSRNEGDFRATIAKASLDKAEHILIDSKIARLLDVTEGSNLKFCPLFFKHEQ